MGIIFHLLLLSIVVGLSFFYEFSSAADTISSSQTLNDSQTLVSNGGTFEMGFFSPGVSKSRYVGIWYKNIPARTVIWVANRVMPVNDSSGVIRLNQTSGNLEILSGNMSISIWSSNSSRQLENPIVQLLDTGNLVLRDEKDGDNPDLYAWQSFDHPSNTFIAGMKIGWDSKSGINRQYTSWKSLDDPSPGSLMVQLNLTPNPELVLWKGAQKLTRSGPWVGTSFSNIPEQKSNQIYDFKFVSDKDDIYYMYTLKNESVIIITVLNETTSTRDRYVWIDAQKTWQLYSSVPGDNCDFYGKCGANGICSINDFPICKCMEGFTPKSPAEWELTDWSGGCVQIEPLNCSLQHDFVKLSNVKLPDTTNSWLNQSMNLEECRLKCLSNCSCMAYTNSDVRNGGTGCAIWFGDLTDIKKLQEDGQDLYIRVPSSGSGKQSKIKIAAIVAASAVCFLIILVAAYCIYRRKNSRGLSCFISLKKQIKLDRTEHNMEDMELPVFSLAKIVKATNSFSMANKLGEGGFGSVYKGTLEDGRQIAVKRLSTSSGQGQVEFKNEVILIAKLQHRNLVRLLGCCLEGIEKMLVYEYMPNKSLDYFIFDQTRSKLLNWPTRLNIISGIARGLLYLHQDSRLRIIHRDLKASNVLLDNDMNPKISDFGMAKTFGGDQTEGNTNRVVGTYGYMAPEYAIDGLFSIKSDVYSFGVLLIEIVSGKRNRGFEHADALNLLEYAWTMWTEGTPLQLVEESIAETCSVAEVTRCVHMGLLCVQQHPEDRPSMASVILMLGSENELPQPQQPAFFKFGLGPDKSKSGQVSSNEVTMTLLGAR